MKSVSFENKTKSQTIKKFFETEDEIYTLVSNLLISSLPVNLRLIGNNILY
jgi:hypothetical protein